MPVRVTYPALTREQVIARLRNLRTQISAGLPILKVILYGSYATGRNTAGSDIDVIIVYDGRERIDAYKIVMQAANLPRLEPKVYTLDQYNSLMHQSARFAETIRKEGIVVI